MKPARSLRSTSAWLIGLVALGVGTELAFRSTMSFQSQGVVRDSLRGYLPASGAWVRWTLEGKGLTHYSGAGEISTPFEDGENVPILGDSFTEALQVDNDLKFASVAERLLRERGICLNIRNLGYMGLGIPDYVLAAEKIRATFRPRVVVVQLSASDFGPEAFSADRPVHFRRSLSGELEIELSPRQHLQEQGGVGDGALAGIQDAARRLVVVSAGRRRLNAWKRGMLGREQVHVRGQAFDLETALDELEMLLKAWDGTILVAVWIPVVPCIEGRTVQVVQQKEHLAVLSLMRIQARMKVVDPTPAFVELYTKHKKLPRGFANSSPGTGHLNQAGHRIVGELLAEALAAADP